MQASKILKHASQMYKDQDPFFLWLQRIVSLNGDLNAAWGDCERADWMFYLLHYLKTPLSLRVNILTSIIRSTPIKDGKCGHDLMTNEIQSLLFCLDRFIAADAEKTELEDAMRTNFFFLTECHHEYLQDLALAARYAASYALDTLPHTSLFMEDMLYHAACQCIYHTASVATTSEGLPRLNTPLPVQALIIRDYISTGEELAEFLHAA